MRRSSLRSLAPPPAPRPSSPLEVIVSVFVDRGVTEIPVPELVCALLGAFVPRGANPDDTVWCLEEAWRSLHALEGTVLELLSVLESTVDIADRGLCPKVSELSLLAIARLRVPLDEAPRLTTAASAR